MILFTSLIFIGFATKTKKINSCQFCSMCVGDNCEECLPGYIFKEVDGNVTNECIPCPNQCTECKYSNEELICTKCPHGKGFEFINGEATKNCIPCKVKNCINCGYNASFCEGCNDGYGLEIKDDIKTGQCDKCDEPCRMCTDVHTCTYCNAGYHLNLAGKCIENPPNCLFADYYSKCSQCEPGFGLEGENYQNNNGTCIKCSDENCNRCDFEIDTCTLCLSGFGFVYENGNSTGKCAQCPDNCRDCSDSSICQECEYGYGVDKETGKCEKCLENCNSCNYNYKMCSYCNSGYGHLYEDGKDTGQCSKCPEKCERCDSNSAMCESCIKGYGFEKVDGEKTGQCVKCNENCYNCGNSTFCEECLKGYTTEIKDGKQTGKCIKCPNNCLKCDPETLACSKCSLFFYLKKDGDKTTGKCVGCPENCFQCSSSNCDSCKGGFGLNAKGGCDKCPDNCLECENNECTKCYDGYGLRGKECVLCAVKDCQNCQKNADICEECSVDSYLSLRTGFVIENGTNTGKCRPCQDTFCKRCVDDYTQCVECEDNYAFFEDENGTKVCTHNPHCDEKSSLNHCSGCDYGYGLVNVGDNILCQKCEVENCDSCNYNTKSCKRCVNGFSFVDGKCTLTDRGIFQCEKPSNSDSGCTYCNSGYGINISNGVHTGECISCEVENCIDCTTDSKFCEECSIGFGFSQDRQCIQCAVKNCENCLSNYSNCIRCKNNYCFDTDENSATFDQCILCEGKEDPDQPIIDSSYQEIDSSKDDTDKVDSSVDNADSSVNNVDSTVQNPTTKPPTQAPTSAAPPAPTRPPIIIEQVDINNFNKDDDGTVKVDITNANYESGKVYKIEIPEEVEKVNVAAGSKDVSFTLPEGKESIAFTGGTENEKQTFDIVPNGNVEITLGENTKASFQEAKGTVTLKGESDKAISLNQVTPQSSETFTLKTSVSVAIDEVDFSGQQRIDVQPSNGKTVDIEKVKIQAHSSGTINNVAIKNIVFAPLSSLNIAGNVDMSESSIDLPFNEAILNGEGGAPLSGDLGKSPMSIVFNARDFNYLADGERFLIAESGSEKFECNDWAATFRKGPINTKFNDAECSEDSKDGKKVKRLHAVVKKDDDDGKGGLSGGAIAGIVIACVVVVGAVVGVLVYFLVIKKKKDAMPSDQEQYQGADEV